MGSLKKISKFSYLIMENCMFLDMVWTEANVKQFTKLDAWFNPTNELPLS